MLQIEKVSKTYHSKGIDYPVLKEITATIHDGEFVAIMGPSGSGENDAAQCDFWLYKCGRREGHS